MVALGRNGSGKTALCRTLAGLEQPLSGAIEQDGRRLDELDTRQRSVGYVTQAFVNYPHWTVAQNIASPLSVRGVDKPAIAAKVRETAERVGIADLLDRYPKTLSGGQQQRLALARALAADAELVVLDEPLVNLDYKLRESLLDEMRLLLKGAGVHVFYATSDAPEAFALADTVVLMADYRVLQVGPPTTVYRQPVNVTAANLMSEPQVNRVAEGEYVRPEHLKADAGDVRRRFDVKVLGVETNGTETFLHAEFCEQAWVARLAGLHNFAVGDVVALHAEEADIIRFT